MVANKLVVMQSGEWVLPYWREQPRNERVMGFTEFKSSCHTPTDGATAARTATGVLVSTDAGGSWRAWGNLTDSRTALIEGTVALLESQKLLMLLRTQTGCTFQSTSTVRQQSCNIAVAPSLRHVVAVGVRIVRASPLPRGLSRERR